MKRTAVIVVAIVVVALVVWLAGRSGIEPAAAPRLAQRSDGEAPAPVLPVAREASAGEPPASASLPPEAAPSAVPLAAPQFLRVAGVVERASDGSPLGDVIVTPLTVEPVNGSTQLRWVETTKAGSFEFGPEITSLGPRYLSFTWSEIAPTRTYDVVVNAPTGRQVTQRVSLAETQMPLDELHVALDTGWIARGHVRDAAGKAVGGAFVATANGAHWGESEPDGAFVVRDLPRDGATVQLVAKHKGFVDARADVALPADRLWETSIEIVLNRGGH